MPSINKSPKTTSAVTRLLRVSDATEYSGWLVGHNKTGAAILAADIPFLCDEDLFVVSYDTGEALNVFIGQVAQDHGIVSAPDGSQARSLVMKPADLVCARL